MTDGSRAGRRGLFVVFEGPEGGGKSTQVALLQERLAAHGVRTRRTREPGGTPAGEAVRGVLLDPGLDIGPLAEFLLYSAARAQHVKAVVAPALTSGEHVLSDRFAAASVAYQGHGRGLDLDFVHRVNEESTAGLVPDLTLLLDVEPRVGLARAAARSAHDRLEAAGLEFHERVRRGFLALAEGSTNWAIIDASADVETVAARVWDAAGPLFGAVDGAASSTTASSTDGHANCSDGGTSSSGTDSGRTDSGTVRRARR